MKRRILGVLLSAVMIVSMWPTVVMANSQPPAPDYSWYGDGSATEYTLSDVEDLMGFANIVNGKAEVVAGSGPVKDSFEGKTVTLVEDIDLTGVVWTPIGTSMYDHAAEDDSTKKFEGTFDGKNHTITGLSSEGYVLLEEDFSSGEHSYGLFGYAYGASVKNVKLAEVDIDCCGIPVETGATADGSGVAALVGFYVTKDNAKSVIENCHLLSGTVTATNNMGGLLGFLQVQGTDEFIDVTVKNCSNAATVITEMREAGGILGLAQLNADDYGTRGDLKFEDCTNYGDVTAKDGAGVSCAGGILGWENTIAYGGIQIIFDKCNNKGNVKAVGKGGAEVHAAGIGSTNYHRGPWLVANKCSNTGNVVIEGSGVDNFVGGIFAYGGFMTIEKCTTTQTVTRLGETSSALIGELCGSGMICLNESAAINNNSGSIYMLNGGTTQPPARYKIYNGSDTYRPSDPTRANFTFGGWYKTTGHAAQTPNYDGEAVTSYPSGNTYHAKWIPDEPKVMMSAVEGDMVTLQATHPVEGVAYTWYKDGELISGETGETLTVEATADQVDYTAKVCKDSVYSDFSEPVTVYDEVKAAIKAALEALTVESYSGVYDGEKHNIVVTCGENVVTCYKDAGYSVVTDGIKDAGEYTIYYKVIVPLNEEELELAGTSTVTIEKAKLKITAENKSAYVNSEQPEFTYKVSGFCGEDTFITEPTLIADAEIDMTTAGEYVITPKDADAGANYEIEYITGKMTVKNYTTGGYTATVSNDIQVSPKSPQPGGTVSVTIPEGTEADGIRVKDSKGNIIPVSLDDGEFTFVMPRENVEIETFVLPFEDVTGDEFFYEPVIWALANEITVGLDGKEFAPGGDLTRGQMVTLLWRMAGCPEPKGDAQDFSDVDKEDFYYKAVLWAAEKGITSGTSNELFSPEVNCSRGQMVVFLNRMSGETSKYDGESFNDVSATDYYADAVQWAVENNITLGAGEDKFLPTSTCTRGQAVTFLYRYCEQ